MLRSNRESFKCLIRTNNTGNTWDNATITINQI